MLQAASGRQIPVLAQPVPAGSVLQGLVPVSPRAPPTAREPEIERMAAAHLTNAARDAFSALSELPMRRTEDSQDGSLSEVGPGTRFRIQDTFVPVDCTQLLHGCRLWGLVALKSQKA